MTTPESDIVAVCTVDLTERREQFTALLRSIPRDIRFILTLRGTADLDPELLELMPVNHTIVRVPQATLSKARNLALDQLRGQPYRPDTIVCFPDDDCTWSESTAEVIRRSFADPAVTLIIGRYRPTDRDFDAIRYPAEPEPLTARLVLTRCASIVTVTRATIALDTRFDERLGVGARLPSAEDTDFALRVLAGPGQHRYEPDLVCFHRYEDLPDPNRKIVAGFIMSRHIWRFPSLVLPTGRWLLRRLRRGPDRARSVGMVLRGLVTPPRRRPGH